MESNGRPAVNVERDRLLVAEWQVGECQSLIHQLYSPLASKTTSRPAMMSRPTLFGWMTHLVQSLVDLWVDVRVSVDTQDFSNVD
jgi:hypothetical protein